MDDTSWVEGREIDTAQKLKVWTDAQGIMNAPQLIRLHKTGTGLSETCWVVKAWELSHAGEAQGQDEYGSHFHSMDVRILITHSARLLVHRSTVGSRGMTPESSLFEYTNDMRLLFSERSGERAQLPKALRTAMDAAVKKCPVLFVRQVFWVE